MSRAAQRVLPVLRSSLRTSQRTSTRAAFSRRTMSSGAPHSSGGSDTPWMVGSALVFGPALLYLLSPSSRKPAHAHIEKHDAHRNDANVKEPEAEEAPAMTDDEGTEASGAEIKESTDRAFSTDSPKDAQAAEEKEASEPAPSESSDAPAEQGEPSESEGSTQTKGADAISTPSPEDKAQKEAEGESNEPTNIGEAREQAVDEQPPKKADPTAES
ncbi:hypothetical protein BV22DRAFT_249174 [Leucogyrophana mollusca]|uniref:Uncharacterized protein n=1 Tax=Leucogyrophana mollusca TaxID=85980 RepID=A0ACB8BPC4_9AGAM|nr:hypothetical protein BV22DRAFT_249174 [Leucogyrophana mollusca]